MKIHVANLQQAETIAKLIMMAMTDDCCLYYAGEGKTLQDFKETMVRLVETDDSQYSYKNTLMATTEDGEVAGICVSYDGGLLHKLRNAFIKAAKNDFGRDFSKMEDETQAGELYLDSLAVNPQFRKKGVATALLKASIEKAKDLGLPAVGLLVDKGNPNAERLYTQVGFKYMNDATWGGHPMKHLVYRI